MSCRSASSITVFTGKREQWPISKVRFESLIAHSSALHDVQKFGYLYCIIYGEVLPIVEQYLFRTKFNVVWNLLIRFYDNLVPQRVQLGSNIILFTCTSLVFFVRDKGAAYLAHSFLISKFFLEHPLFNDKINLPFSFESLFSHFLWLPPLIISKIILPFRFLNLTLGFFVNTSMVIAKLRLFFDFAQYEESPSRVRFAYSRVKG